MDGIGADQESGEGEGGTPVLALDGYNGPLERLLTLARGHQIDLARLPLGALVDQLAAALQDAPPATPLGRKGDWVVMASWLLQLRSLLLLPAGSAAQQAAAVEADRLRLRLIGLREIQALAAWLDRRAQLGRDVFARGQPELLGTSSFATGHEVDVVGFLWACLALFDDAGDAAATETVYRPRWFEPHAVPEARDRILRRLAETPDGGPLGRFLPDASAADTPLRRRSAWSSTFAASLELTKRGDVALAQGGLFMPIRVSRAASAATG
jgi:segregation and condensation protein A